MHPLARVARRLVDQHRERLLRGVPIPPVDLGERRRPRLPEPRGPEGAVVPGVEGLAAGRPLVARVGDCHRLWLAVGGYASWRVW